MWFLTLPLLAYTAAAVWLFRHPDRVSNDWPAAARKLFALGMVAIGVLLTFLAVYGAVTGHCLGTDLDSN